MFKEFICSFCSLQKRVMSAGLLVEPSTAVFVILGREKSTMKHRFSPNEELSCFHVNALMLKKK